MYIHALIKVIFDKNVSHKEKEFVYGQEFLNGLIFVSFAYNIPYEVRIILYVKLKISKIYFRKTYFYCFQNFCHKLQICGNAKQLITL